MSNLLAVHYCELRDFAASGLKWADSAFNGAGYFPIIHKVSGGIRIYCGNVMAITTLALSAILFFGSLFAQSDNKKVYREIARDLLRFSFYGGCHILRGFVECTKGWHYMCILYDWEMTKKPALCLSYDKPIFNLPVYTVKENNA